MGNQDLAIDFLRRFCAGDVDGLRPLLTEDLKFHGPLMTSVGSAVYLKRLEDDPPQKNDFRVMHVSENGDSVSVFYEYLKDSGALTVAQLFKFRNGKISEILMVFDGRGFA